MIIYVDVLFFRELLMNGIIIVITGKILAIPISIKRFIVSCMIGGTSTIVCLFTPPIWIMFLRILVISLIVVTAYHPKDLINFLKDIITFYSVTFFIAGIGFYTIEEKLKRFLLIATLGWCIVKLIQAYQEKYRIQHFTYWVEMNLRGEKYRFSAFVDTGNFLKSSFGEDVMILSPRVVKKIKNQEFQDILQGNMIDDKYKEKIRYITYESLGNLMGVKPGIKLDNVILNQGEKKVKKEVVVIMGDIDFKNCDSLIGLSLIGGSDALKNVILKTKGGKKNGNFTFFSRKSKKII